ncbi:MAG TPA: tetratricopeptide repeat protein [Planctomycetota bacterium]|nr:tetratricopeptide repeat protein [Planctomycetota bacterium]
MSAKEVFLDALERSEAERAAFLDRACANDAQLRKDVDALLAAHATSATWLVDRARRVHVPAADSGPFPGDEVGDYRLESVLGEGGFGRVFLAQRLRPVAMRVALKVAKPGTDAARALARFAAERDVLARMEHPGIARVLDAGTTADGRPFFAMELVDGEPITSYCESRRLGSRARAEILRLVALAVQHAHGKGVIHRDLKPGNVLVGEADGAPAPRVIDFGIAKALEDDDRGTLARTREGQVVGTPSYWSPEQAAGSTDVDVRSDVYALGALLHEALSGAPPFEASGTGLAALLELQRRIREESPRRASARPSPTLGERVPPDLDWIALRCLEKDRERRYPTAAALAADLGRFLASEPVEAAPPSRVYRLRRMARRHRAAAVAASVALAAIVAGAIGVGLSLRRAREETERARIAFEVASAVNDFVTRDLLSAARPSTKAGGGRDVTLAEALDAAAARISGRFAGAPVVEAKIRDAIGQTYASLGREGEALPHLERALSLIERELGASDPETLRARTVLAGAKVNLGKYAEGEAGLRQALPPLRAALGAGHRDVLVNQRLLGTAVWRLGRLDEAASLLRDAVAEARAAGRGSESEALVTLQTLAIVETLRGRGDEVEALFREVHESLRDSLGADDPSTITALSNRATYLRTRGKPAEARPLFEEAVAASDRVLGPDHPDSIVASEGLGGALLELGDLDGAEERLVRCLETLRARRGPGHPSTLAAMNEVARLRDAQGRHDDAQAIFRDALDRCRSTFGPDHPETVMRLHNLALWHVKYSDPATARPLLEEAIERSGDRLARADRSSLDLLRLLGSVLRELGEWDEAERRFLEVLERTKGFAPGDELVRITRNDLDLLRRKRDRAETAPAR